MGLLDLFEYWNLWLGWEWARIWLELLWSPQVGGIQGLHHHSCLASLPEPGACCLYKHRCFPQSRTWQDIAWRNVSEQNWFYKIQHRCKPFPQCTWAFLGFVLDFWCCCFLVLLYYNQEIQGHQSPLCLLWDSLEFAWSLRVQLKAEQAKHRVFSLGIGVSCVDFSELRLP